MIWIATNPFPFEQAKAHLVETMFYDEWAPSRESSVSKPSVTFVPKWGGHSKRPKTQFDGVVDTKEKKERSANFKAR